MTDQTLEDKVREIASRFRDQLVPHIPAAEYEVWERATEAVEALLLPPRPTLADMTSEERAGCKWMQCDVGGEDARAVIFDPHWEHGSARIMWPDGVFTYPNWERVTPRPDLPRFVWPTDTPAPVAPEGYPPRDQLTRGAKWADIAKLEEALTQKGEAADQAIVLDDAGEVYVWEAAYGGRWMARYPVQKYGPFRVIYTGQGADQ